MDVLSEVLKTITLDGALFYNAEFSSPWCFRSPPSHAIAARLGPGARHVIVYHLVLEGGAWVQVENSAQVRLEPGDVVVFPHGDAHLMGNGPPSEPVDNEEELERILSHGLEIVRMGGGGEVTTFVCGYLACEPHLSRCLLASLPSMLVINVRQDGEGAWIEDSIRFSVAHAGAAAAGAEAVRGKLSEALFAETLRRYLARAPAEQMGWLAGARDPEIGKALALLHGEPARPWTIAHLAAGAGVSRAVLAERFRHYLGEPPITYLTHLRLQLGARMLAASNAGVAQIAAQVGYCSEAAFNRAFKRLFGVPPARFRRESRPFGEPRSGS